METRREKSDELTFSFSHTQQSTSHQGPYLHIPTEPRYFRPPWGLVERTSCNDDGSELPSTWRRVFGCKRGDNQRKLNGGDQPGFKEILPIHPSVKGISAYLLTVLKTQKMMDIIISVYSMPEYPEYCKSKSSHIVGLTVTVT